ncbi:hypothetical protein Daura_29180 [Dactylosporangium aurantiacum]|uniref:Uncharacterized protein n=1 Tax=Dactylosporangium aurantiacum TaxID=35754 RepID=A0A9Q9MCF5_9ACTN|nr:hypothetical protein [Dactylosporangium aurantiacum]MDG6106727.1 hypothetical protein [Dactylosporangium aurantiacum]UWZ50874.1 hypothetical protein Daura_29180 [Dactylosporangium aurantiacum]
MPSLISVPWIAVVALAIPSVAKLVIIMVVLRNTKPSERPAILRALAGIVRPTVGMGRSRGIRDEDETAKSDNRPPNG